ncbi:YihA family ribosome biogenesis GTP-binding protein [Coxiella endosymbiont of Amblyomma sculptum]|uniref:ribosome biogenesis GTP-binding protein YihA/YsxC n=1 Tax=Coxiella endosymbiont of Amblyomma sculptum TaxID=2487929 RepID=UPI00132E9E97|nr:ribosome biogenesis GTP-binding protein YihA/YsxC [Coxiella endosymbiont of Amblyomma sculptum]QHG92226.1 YihA family ribosome biogenesis GTP-binding protein [Coxiella endosymbiont of Amblyomma sculptum]
MAKFILPVYQEAKYLTSAAEFSDLPPDTGVEIAFIGRSNAGKSSALNVITGIKGLARISKTPGRTQMINFFSLNEKQCLVDLPGYGYAKVPRMIQERWEKLVNSYLKRRSSLRGLVVVMDIRHPLKEADEDVIEGAMKYSVPLHILLTKSDKLGQSVANRVFSTVQSRLIAYSDEISVQLFSSHDRTGLDEVKMLLNNWYIKKSNTKKKSCV